MKKCDPRAFARCPGKRYCGNVVDAEFAEGSDCDKFNQSVLSQQVTNADRIRGMTDEELAEFIRSMIDGSNSHGVSCYGCIHYGTHHSDPENKGTYLYECEGCEGEGIGLDVLKWLQLSAKEETT